MPTLCFDAEDFTLEVELKLLDKSSRTVRIDVFSLNDEFVRLGNDQQVNDLPPAEFFASHQGIVCKFLKVEPEQLPPGMAYRIMQACVEKMREIKKKESGEVTPGSPPAMDSLPSV